MQVTQGWRIDPTRPIYAQIVEAVTQGVVRGELEPGAALPSVRALAGELRVNPNTVQRAYRELEALGVVETHPGQGTFVTARRDVVAALRERLAAAIVQRAARELLQLGVEPEEIGRLMRTALARADHGGSEA
jgi:GntR family transcriptional regulator